MSMSAYGNDPVALDEATDIQMAEREFIMKKYRFIPLQEVWLSVPTKTITLEEALLWNS